MIKINEKGIEHFEDHMKCKDCHFSPFIAIYKKYMRAYFDAFIKSAGNESDPLKMI